MSLHGQQVLSLFDGQGQEIGQVIVDRVEDNLVFGQFIPGPAYAKVGHFFSEYVEAANQQLLSIVGELDATISTLGLHLRSTNGTTLPAIDDVQIGEGIVTFRIRSSGGRKPDPVDCSTAIASKKGGGSART